MTEESGSSLSVLQAHAAAAASEIKQAVNDLASLLTSEQHALGRDVLQPAQRLVRGVAGLTEVVVDPLAQLVERQRELADQMAAWAELQHQLADQMAAWADLQRQLANAVGLWLAPASGTARVTRRVLHDIAGDASRTEAPPASAPAQRRRPPARTAKAAPTGRPRSERS